MLSKKQTESLQLSIDFERNKIIAKQQVTIETEIDIEELYKYDPDEPWWNRQILPNYLSRYWVTYWELHGFLPKPSNEEHRSLAEQSEPTWQQISTVAIPILGGRQTN